MTHPCPPHRPPGRSQAATIALAAVLAVLPGTTACEYTAEADTTGGKSSGSNRAVGKRMAAKKGWTGRQWHCLNKLWTAESNWRTRADNPTSSAYGIPQALPGRKMRSAGDDWRTNPKTQIKWGLRYIDRRYGTPCSAWSFHRANNWY
jgi:hypothetical protein